MHLRRPRHGSGPAILGRLLGWLVVAALGGFTVVRLVQPGGLAPVVVLIALTPWWYFAAWPVAIVALARRSWSLAAPALALIAVQVALVLPVVRPWSTAVAPTGTWRLRVFDGNVRYNNPSLTEVGREIRGENPDLVTLEEVSTPDLPSLIDTGALSGFRWHYVHPEYDASGFGIWSKLPLTNVRLLPIVGDPAVGGELRPPGQEPLHLVVVHTLAPRTDSDVRLWTAQLAGIAETIRSIGRPLVVIGDFNATSDMRQFQQLTDLLQDAGVTTGNGWRMTWPDNRAVVPPLVRIDHALYSPQLTATSYRLGEGAGSDHRPLEVTFARATA